MAVAVLKIWAPSTFVCVSVYLPVQDIFLSAGQKVPGATKFPLNTRRIAGSESQSWGCVTNSQSHLWTNGQVYTAWHRLLLEFIRVMWQRLSNYDELCFACYLPLEVGSERPTEISCLATIRPSLSMYLLHSPDLRLANRR